MCLPAFGFGNPLTTTYASPIVSTCQYAWALHFVSFYCNGQNAEVVRLRLQMRAFGACYSFMAQLNLSRCVNTDKRSAHSTEQAVLQ